MTNNEINNFYSHTGEENLNRIEFIFCSFCTRRWRTPFELMSMSGLSLQMVYQICSSLINKGFLSRTQTKECARYTSWLSNSELEEGLKKWPEIDKLYPGIREFLDRRRGNGTENNSGNTQNTKGVADMDTTRGL